MTGTVENGVRGRTRACDLHLRKVALYLTELREQKMASVIGLAPIRVGLKIRLRELLCIHGHFPEVGIAPTSPRLQRGANLSQLLRVRVVVLAGNAPASSGYQPAALLLSYGTICSRGLEPKPREGLKTRFNFPAQWDPKLGIHVT